MSVYVYFIQSREGLVKIGRSRTPEKRFRVLRCGSPGAVLLGIRDDLSESELHARFASSREAGEWFRPSPELLALAVEGSGTTSHADTENARGRWILLDLPLEADADLRKFARAKGLTPTGAARLLILEALAKSEVAA